MRPLTPARTIPTSARYLAVKLGERGEHHFKMPLYGTVQRLVEWAQARMDAVLPPVPDEDMEAWRAAVAATPSGATPPDMPTRKAAPDFVPVHEVVSAALVGAAWFHRGLALDARTDLDDLDAYGAAVAEELEEYGYAYTEIAALGNAVRVALVDYFNAGMTAKAEAIAAGKPLPA